MRPLSYIICAAGEGKRFREYGLNEAKPLLKLKGRTMLERSIESLEILPQDQLIIIGRKEDRLKEKLDNLKNVTWVETQEKTHGQLSTYLLASNLVINDDIAIYNCDTFFHCPSLRKIIESSKYKGIIPCSQEEGDAWSFCKVDENLNILEVAEKERISDWASVGFYYFQGKQLLEELAQEEIKLSEQKETYIAPIYNRYLEKKMPLKMVPVQAFLPFGTVEQVERYWRIGLDELLSENS